MTLECAHCLLERAINQIKLATDDPGLRMQIVEAMTQFLGENFNGDAVPSHIGTDRDLLVQRMTGKDPYEDLKHQSNEMALSIMPELQKLVDESIDSVSRFRTATLITAAANAIEFDVAGRDFDLDELREILNNVESDLVIDQVDEFRSLLNSVDEVLYLMDNAGELVLDMILIREIKRLGPRVIAVVKGGPVLNDATMIDAKEVGLSECADEVRDTGASSIGVNLERNSDEFKKLFSSAQLIVAKGMGNFESLTEFSPSCPTIHIMRTKCNPVAEHVGVSRNKNVVLIRMPPETK
ncbi:MAG: DUF89 domain-containing protein [Candidatus Thorarchaeota archaeon]